MEKDASEIVKLTERIAKDPKSKLFVPLAEEYKKIGDIEMAINVLQEGLKNNPSYVTARSFLGRLLLESGDLPGAQKELEEVIKAIPDNLLAQRKLGDLYILTGRSADALQRYKTALALNPGDKEVTALVADLEAGKDIADRIPKPKAAPSPPAASAPQAKAPPASKTAPAAAASVPPARPAPAPPASPAPPSAPAAPKPAPGAAPQMKQNVAPTPPKQDAPAPVLEVPEETDTVEEIIDLEHLEQPEALVEPVVFPEKVTAAGPAPSPREPAFDLSAGTAFDLSEAGTTEAPIAGEVETVSWEPPAPEATPASVEPEAVDWAASAQAAAPQEESSDDINTNTLAELYITQGFYEKAIEIYEGMLAENPNNRALRQKLEKIRAMAGVTEQNAAFTTPAPTRAEDGAKSGRPAAEAETPGEAAAAKDAGAVREVRPAASAAPDRPAPADTTLPRSTPPAAAATPSGPQGASVRRKETIDRLESWLKNIIKEKP